MKTKFQSLLFCILFTSFFLGHTELTFADENSTPVPKSSDAAQAKPSDGPTSSTLVIHKPAIDPTWGKVVQFQVEQAVNTSDKTPETQYKFLFQDSKGIVRTAIYHENNTGGYWEVWVWDQL